MDAGYAPFVNLLQQTTGSGPTLKKLTDETIYGATAYYFGSLPVELVPAFSRVLVSSPYLWVPPPSLHAASSYPIPLNADAYSRTWRHLLGVQVAVRQALRTRFESLKKVTPSGFIFAADVGTPLREWVDAVRSGVELGLGNASYGTASRPAEGTRDLYFVWAAIGICGGLLLGADDVLASNFQASAGIPTVDVSRLDAARNLLRKDLARMCREAVGVHSAMDGAGWGNALRPMAGLEAPSLSRTIDSPRHITSCLLAKTFTLLPNELLRDIDLASTSRLTLDSLSYAFQDGLFLRSLTQNPPSPSLLLDNAGPLAHLIARSLHGLSTKDIVSTWEALERISATLKELSKNVSVDWTTHFLMPKQETPEPVWQTLKILLFSCLIVSQSVVDTCAFYHPPPRFLNQSGSSQSPLRSTAIASTLLESLSNLSFISSRFGGLTADGGALPQQKRVFFGSLDILASEPAACEGLLKSLSELQDSAQQSRSAFLLACIEQLVPSLNDSTLEFSVIPFARCFLDDPRQRETFESSHSVILAILANNGVRERRIREGEDRRDKIATRLAPFYLRCLMENSKDDCLSSGQLRLAFGSLVQSLTASREEALTWFCIETLLETLELSMRTAQVQRAERLRLALISSLPAVSLPLLPKLFEVLERELGIERVGGGVDIYWKEVSDQMFSHVGDVAKDISVRWFMGVRTRLSQNPRIVNATL